MHKPLTRSPTRRPLDLEPLDALGSAQALAAIAATGMSPHELNRWAARHPDEVPLVNGELLWIALGLADLG